MYYRLSYSHEDLTDIKELNTRQDRAEIEAWELLDKHNQIGTVVIERRQSEYYGDYRHVLTISQGPEGDIISNKPKLGLGNIPFYKTGKQFNHELCIFKQLKLDEEPKELRRLLWICECKSLAIRGSDTKKMLIDLQEKQIDIIRNSGISFEDIVEFAEQYEFADLMLMS